MSSYARKQSKFVEYFDIYGTGMKINVFGDSSYKTLFGSIISIISVLTVIAMTGAFIKEFLHKCNVSVIFNEYGDRYPSNNLTENYLLFNLFDSEGNLITEKNLFDFKILLKTHNISAKNKIIHTEKILSYAICNKNLFKDTLKLEFLETKISSLDNYYCILPGQNVHLDGAHGDYNQGFTSVEFIVNFSKNSNYSNINLGIVLIDNFIDHFNINNPKHTKITFLDFPFNYYLTKYKQYNMYIRQIIYETDYGFILDDWAEKSFPIYSHFNSLEMNNSNKTLGIVSIRNSDQVSIFTRRYIKIHMLLANIGGVVKGIMALSQAIVMIFTRRLILRDLSNSISTINDVEEIKQGISFDSELRMSGLNRNFSMSRDLYMFKNESK